MLLDLPKNTWRGPGFWKFNNTLLDDKEYLENIQKIYPKLREKLKNVQDKWLFWELLQTEIRSITTAFTRGKCKLINKCKSEVGKLLADLDVKIFKSKNLQDIDCELRIYKDLKEELQKLYEHKGKAAMFWSKRHVGGQQKIPVGVGRRLVPSISVLQPDWLKGRTRPSWLPDNCAECERLSLFCFVF